MPGIVGIIGEPESGDIISLMVQKMKHEEFYYIDTYKDENISIGITSLSPDNKILCSSSKTLFSFIDGEIFGLPEKDEINYLLSLYEKNEKEFLNIWEKIDGWFNFALYDKRRKKFFLVSDRYGFRPLYYTYVNDKFIFASEIKAILAYPKIRKELDLIGVAEYEVFNYPLNYRTFIKNIHRFPPASIWCWRKEPSFQKYWRIEKLLPKDKIPSRKSLEQSGKVFKKVVTSLVKSEEKIGLTLTAGYDTRTILASLSDYNVNCLTFGEKRDIQALIASKLAKITNNNHYIQEFDDSFTSHIYDFLYKTAWITDGLCNIVQCGLLYVFKKQRSFVNPCFLGFGGSEIIRGHQNTALSFHINAKRILLSQTPIKTFKNIYKTQYPNFFSTKFLKKQESEDLILQDLEEYIKYPIKERILFFTILEVFRKYYSPITMLLNSQVSVRVPYMSHNFLSFILRTPYSILSVPHFSKNLFKRVATQRLSASIIKYNDPKLLYVCTDRGYSPKWNLSLFGYPVIFWHLLYKIFFPNPISELPLLRSTTQKILKKIIKTKSKYYNLYRLKKMLSPKNFFEWQEMLKIVTFEIWRQQL